MKFIERVHPTKKTKPPRAPSQVRYSTPLSQQSLPVQTILSLQKAAGNQASQVIIQRWKASRAQIPATKRQDYVFIMGADRKGRRNKFYGTALRYYQASIPDAIFKTNIRTLSGLLTWVRDNVTQPIGNLYIVTHGYEDGTLSFGLDKADRDKKIGVVELRDALHPSQGQSQLPQLGKQIDKQTRIHIKGCNIGRSQNMVELVDEAFGGTGVVTAPTHEQEFGYRPKFAKAMKTKLRKEVESKFPLPLPVDPILRGTARRNALRERRRALSRRRRAIKAELKRLRTEHHLEAERAGVYEAFSGPFFQRPGTHLFTAAEMKVLVDGMYSHLPARRRAALVRALVRRDRRRGFAKDRPTQGQKGQRVYRNNIYNYSFKDPKNEKEARRIALATIRKEKRKVARKFKAGKVTISGRRITVIGTYRGKPLGFHIDLDPIISDAALLRSAQALMGNPGNYRFRLVKKSKRGKTYVKVVCERVIAYLHHAGLNVSSDKPFTAPTTDRRMYATSTYTPRP